MTKGRVRRFLTCPGCGSQVPIRTFKAGRFVCSHCGASRGLDEGLAARLRAAAMAEPSSPQPPEPKVEPDPDARARMHPLLLALAALILGVAAWWLFAT